MVSNRRMPRKREKKMKKGMFWVLFFQTLMAVGIVLSVEIFTDNGLNVFGLSFVTGWVFAIAFLATTLFAKLSRWIPPD